ncbi:MAG: xanthine dehydrogenase family protein molybdopterin-binding subunit, partial [Deltaproteobacteria bacterium]
FACDVIEVEVDLDTFEVRVCDAWLVDDIGTVINPVLAAGQVEGGTLQGLGYALSEEVVMAEGRMANHRLTNYIIPTTLDAPRMHTEFLAFPFSHGPFGAKGVGELPFDGVAPAVLAAIDHAIGTFLTEIPATPERIMKAWKGGREGK